MTTTKALAEALRKAYEALMLSRPGSENNEPTEEEWQAHFEARRTARETLAKFDAQAAEQAAGGGEAVAWMDDGTKIHNGPGKPAYRVITAETKRNMPRSVQEEYTTPLYARPALSDAEIDALRRDAERIQHFERMADQGYCPSLVFDDDGRWAVSYSGAAPVPEPEGHQETVFITVEVEPDLWRHSVREAIDAALAARGETR